MRRSRGVITDDTGESYRVSKRRSRCVTMPTAWPSRTTGHAGDVLGTRELEHFADGRLGAHGDRVVDDAALEALHPRHLPGLRLDGHVLVDDADAALLRDGDREAVLGHGIHRGRDDRQV